MKPNHIKWIEKHYILLNKMNNLNNLNVQHELNFSTGKNKTNSIVKINK